MIFLHHEIGNNAIGGFLTSCAAESELIAEAWSIENILCYGWVLQWRGVNRSCYFSYSITSFLIHFLIMNKYQKFNHQFHNILKADVTRPSLIADNAHLLFNPHSVSTSANKRDILKIIFIWMSREQKANRCIHCIRSHKLLIIAKKMRHND